MTKGLEHDLNKQMAQLDNLQDKLNIHMYLKCYINGQIVIHYFVFS